jgi:hypothetical protein
MDSEVKSSGTETAARSPGRAFIKAAALNHNVRASLAPSVFIGKHLGWSRHSGPRPTSPSCRPLVARIHSHCTREYPWGLRDYSTSRLTHGSGPRSSVRTGGTSRRKSGVAREACRAFSLRLCYRPRRVVIEL